VLLVSVATLAVLQAERGHPDAHITDFGQAVWWAITTITTVGYGDMYPVTTTGRVIAALLMIGGISLVGSITATIASWIVQSVADDDAATAAVTAAHINELRAEIASLREELRVPSVEGSETDHRP
jgi:voltage-gated potassium channel